MNIKITQLLCTNPLFWKWERTGKKWLIKLITNKIGRNINTIHLNIKNS